MRRKIRTQKSDHMAFRPLSVISAVQTHACVVTARHSEQNCLKKVLRRSFTNMLVASARMTISQDVCAGLVVPRPWPRWVRVDTELNGLSAEKPARGLASPDRH